MSKIHTLQKVFQDPTLKWKMLALFLSSIIIGIGYNQYFFNDQEQQNEKVSIKSEQIIPRNILKWKDIGSGYQKTQKVSYSFKYPDALFMQEDQTNINLDRNNTGGYRTFNFFESQNDSQAYNQCLNEGVESEEKWHSCQKNYLLFKISIGEDSQFITNNYLADLYPLRFSNLNQIHFATSNDLSAGPGSFVRKDAYIVNSTEGLNEIKIFIEWPSEEAIDKTLLLTGLNQQDLFKKILGTLKFESDIKYN